MRSESTWCRRVSMGAVLILLAACGDDTLHATTVDPSFDDPCLYAGNCSQHGQCAGTPDAGPMCLCNVGYMDAKCATCETGFHLDSRGRCAPDRSCAEQPSNPCGQNGACNDRDGVIMCKCETGYEGPRCTLCADGYGRSDQGDCLMIVIGGGSGGSGAGQKPPSTSEPDGSDSNGNEPGTNEPPAQALCTPDSCAGHGTCDGKSGRITCSCETGYSGDRCVECAAEYRRDTDDACVPFDKCASGSCTGHGTCKDDGGVIACTCDRGWGDAACVTCAPGFHTDGSSCTLDDSCLSNTCAGHGACTANAGTTSCACTTEYSGANCELCANGYHRNGAGACAVNEVCASNSCGANGDCDAGSGVIVCKCDDGYAGAACAACAPGFHDAGGNCVLNQQCQPGSCTTHSTCDESSGVIQCSCNAGYAGTTCDECANGYYLDFAKNACLVFSCEQNPIAAAAILTFEDVKFFPNYANNCGTKADVNTDDVEFLSIGGDGTVWSCAPSDIYGLSTRHVLLEAGMDSPAQLNFAGPIASLQFDYAAKSDLGLQVLADGAVISTLTAPKKSHGSLSFTFDAPITQFALRSTTAFTNEIGLDNIAYSPPACK